jgi:hypothetical protein
MNLRARILALILASSLLSALGMLWVLWENRTDAVLRAQSQLTSLTESTAKDLDDRVSGTAQLLFGLSQVPVVSSDDAAACSDFLADVLNEHPQYTGLLTILRLAGRRSGQGHRGVHLMKKIDASWRSGRTPPPSPDPGKSPLSNGEKSHTKTLLAEYAVAVRENKGKRGESPGRKAAGPT